MFWTEEIGRFNERNGIQIGNTEKARVIAQIKRDIDQDFGEHPGVPVLFTQSTDWKGRPFIRLLDLITRDETPPDCS